jgi:hypothetical protein
MRRVDGNDVEKLSGIWQERTSKSQTPALAGVSEHFCLKQLANAGVSSLNAMRQALGTDSSQRIAALRIRLSFHHSTNVNERMSHERSMLVRCSAARIARDENHWPLPLRYVPTLERRADVCGALRRGGSV